MVSRFDVQANLPETSPFLSAQMIVLSVFFQVLIVLVMFNYQKKEIIEPLRKGNVQGSFMLLHNYRNDKSIHDLIANKVL